MKTIKINDYRGTVEFVVDKIVAWSFPDDKRTLTIHTVSGASYIFAYDKHEEELDKMVQLLHDAVRGRK